MNETTGIKEYAVDELRAISDTDQHAVCGEALRRHDLAAAQKETAARVTRAASIAGGGQKARFLTSAILTAAWLLASGPLAHAAQTDLPGPTGTVKFGTAVAVLPNGNFVVTDPNYSIPAGAANVGAVYLYNGATLAVISTLTGSTASDQVGSGGVTVLANGNYVVSSPIWDNAGVVNAGAVTWGSGTAGVSGPVSAGNSLVGSTADDLVGLYGVTALANGNYVVRSPIWDNGGAADAGAVTWGSGTAGVSGPVSADNSLVGSTASDQVGYRGVTVLANGNFVVSSPIWDNAGVVNAGAVTWGSGTTGVSGVVSAANSLVGSTADDLVGLYGVTALANGNYVVSSPNWDNGVVDNAGAVTWGSGTTGVKGAVSTANSLVGSQASDQVGNGYVTALTNGNYVVSSPYWHNVAVVEAGAVTWGSGTAVMSTAVSTANSLVGSQASDRVGNGGVRALANGNYVVSSLNWKNGTAAYAGAVTWGSGTAMMSAVVSAANSLVGSTANDNVGNGGVTALTNGNYVVSSPWWDGAVVDAGAVTWGSGTLGVKGAVSTGNSLVGSTANDQVGQGGVTALTNGNYVVSSPWWDGTAANAGAVTWGNGVVGTVGTIAAANSVLGDTTSGGTTMVSAFDPVKYRQVVGYPAGNRVILRNLVQANAASYGRAWGTFIRIPIANLLATYTAGDTARQLVSVGNGNAGTVPTYSVTPPTASGYILLAPTHNNEEVFSYSMRRADTPDDTASSTITVTVTNAFSAVNSISNNVTGGTVTITFAGIPGYNYVVERTGDLLSWATVQTKTAPNGGVWTFTDPTPPNPSFYRLRQDNNNPP
jgi:hypothetical protein